jgi:hypothetical protein
VSLLAACIAWVPAFLLAAAADKVSDLQTHFDQESHAGAKIKILEKLGEAQSVAASHAQKENNFVAIAFIFEKYRDNVRAALDLLKKQEPNADKHSDGYRHLELQVRRGIREVEEIIIIVPQEVRPPLEIVREDLIHIDDELIHLLFPPPAKTKNSTPAKEEKA